VRTQESEGDFPATAAAEVAGQALRSGLLTLSETTLVVSGRAAVELALPLRGFLRDNRTNAYPTARNVCTATGWLRLQERVRRKR
jgi:formate dehydrogenase assembly factor FdhD